MLNNTNGYNPVFSFPMDKEDMGYFKKEIENIFQEMYGINNHSWNGQRCTHSETISQDRTQGHNIDSEEPNHVERRNKQEESVLCYSYSNEQKTSKKEGLPSYQNDNPEKLFSDILNTGIDDEDMDYLKRSFYQIMKDNPKRPWSQNLQWIHHPSTSDDNESGCARTQGHYKRARKFSKMQPKYKQQKIEPVINGRLTSLPYKKTYKGNKQACSREARNDQRRLSTAYQTITHSNLLKLNELKFRKKKLRLGKSEIHGLGLFAAEPIGPNEIIIEYVGQIIRPIIADLRENSYKQSGLGYYCFLIDDGTVVDATKYGNINRYINHSCNPNSYAKILVINNQKKIVIYSKRHIKADEEITYDYKMKIEDEKIECLCKAPGCRKSLN